MSSNDLNFYCPTTDEEFYLMKFYVQKYDSYSRSKTSYGYFTITSIKRDIIHATYISEKNKLLGKYNKIKNFKFNLRNLNDIDTKNFIRFKDDRKDDREYGINFKFIKIYNDIFYNKNIEKRDITSIIKKCLFEEIHKIQNDLNIEFKSKLHSMHNKRANVARVPILKNEPLYSKVTINNEKYNSKINMIGGNKKHKCNAKTKSGKKCKNLTKTKSQKCYLHK